jgi:trk system potassium uptake protein TrkA
MEIVTFRIEENSRLAGMPLRRLGARFGQKVLVCCVEREDTVQIPGGDFVLCAGDRISVTGSPDALRRFFISAGSYKKPVRNVILLGGSRIAVHLTGLLESTGADVTIIEQDGARCQVLAEQLKDTAILCADGTDTAVLQENGIRRADGFVALTGSDEDNIILGLYAARTGVGKVISKVNNDRFAELLRDISPDTTLSPQELVAERICGYVRGLDHASEKSTIEALYYLGDPRVTATEFVVGAKAACAGKALKDLPLSGGVLLAAVMRGGRSFLPDGQTVLLPDDRVIVVTANRTIVELDGILSAWGKAV